MINQNNLTNSSFYKYLAELDTPELKLSTSKSLFQLYFLAVHNTTTDINAEHKKGLYYIWILVNYLFPYEGSSPVENIHEFIASRPGVEKHLMDVYELVANSSNKMFAKEERSGLCNLWNIIEAIHQDESLNQKIRVRSN